MPAGLRQAQPGVFIIIGLEGRTQLVRCMPNLVNNPQTHVNDTIPLR